MNYKHLIAVLLLLPLTGGYLFMLLVGVIIMIGGFDGLRGNELLMVLAVLVFSGYGLFSLWNVLLGLSSKPVPSLSPFITLGLLSGVLSLAVADYALITHPTIIKSFNLRMLLLFTLNAGPALILFLAIKQGRKKNQLLPEEDVHKTPS